MFHRTPIKLNSYRHFSSGRSSTISVSQIEFRRILTNKFYLRVKRCFNEFFHRPEYMEKRRIENRQENVPGQRTAALPATNDVTKRDTITLFRYLCSVTLTCSSHVAKLPRTNEINWPIIFSEIINPLISLIRD